MKEILVLIVVCLSAGMTYCTNCGKPECVTKSGGLDGFGTAFADKFSEFDKGSSKGKSKGIATKANVVEDRTKKNEDKPKKNQGLTVQKA